MKRESHGPDLILFLVTVALLSIGVIMVFSSSSIKALEELGDPYYYLKRQLFFAMLGIVAMIVVMNIDYKTYARWTVPFLVVSLVLLIMVPFIGAEISGSRRWLNLGLFNLQPSELGKLAMILFVANWVVKVKGRIQNFFVLLVPLLVMGVFFALIMMEPDLGTAATLAATTLIMLFASGAKIGHFFLLAIPAVPAFIALVLAEPYRLRRLMAFRDPWSDPLGAGFHIIQSLLALGSGGLFGLGLGRSRQKFWYLPEQHTDFIFAILGEELGFIGTFLVLVLFLLFAWRGLRIAMTAPDLFSSILSVGITAQIVLQAVVNIGVVSGTLPITGITLPLISYGGSSLLITLSAVGVLLNISRQRTFAK
ncbi:MAG: putative lipid II flippase FtsW [Firmicutes bacterium]|nr:putative lipid II flippase FtsW [Bacillota bacterium]HQD39054.1 putative lipid II flippase FtsW [Bacillota bacterium]